MDLKNKKRERKFPLTFSIYPSNLEKLDKKWKEENFEDRSEYLNFLIENAMQNKSIHTITVKQAFHRMHIFMKTGE